MFACGLRAANRNNIYYLNKSQQQVAWIFIRPTKMLVGSVNVGCYSDVNFFYIHFCVLAK